MVHTGCPLSSFFNLLFITRSDLVVLMSFVSISLSILSITRIFDLNLAAMRFGSFVFHPMIV